MGCINYILSCVYNKKGGEKKIILNYKFKGGHIWVDEIKNQKKGTFVKLCFC